MAKWTYDEALRRLLAHEGGYTNHPSDPGGPTNFGITIHDYRKYVKPNATAADVKAMRLDEAKTIYRAKYWNAMRCDELPAGVDYCVLLRRELRHRPCTEGAAARGRGQRRRRDRADHARSRASPRSKGSRDGDLR